MTTGTEQRLGDISNRHNKTVMSRSIQGILLKDNFDDSEQWDDALNTKIFTDNDSDANHITTVDSSNSRVKMDGDTTAGSSRISTKKKFGKFTVIRAELTTTTLTPNAAGSVYASIRLIENSTRFIQFGALEDGATIDSYAVARFRDSTESSTQEKDFAPGATDAASRHYKIILTDNQAHFYTRAGASGPWTYHGQIGIEDIEKFNVELMVETEAATDVYANVFWGSFQISTLDFNLMEDLQDQLETSEATAGFFGIFSGAPVGEHENSIFWFHPTAQGDGSGTTALNAAAGADDNPATFGTASKDQVFFYLSGNYDFSGATTGLTASVIGIHYYGLGMMGSAGASSTVVNSNGSATGVISVSASHNEVAGFFSNEATNTVEFLVVTASGGLYRNNQLDGAMENGFGLTNASHSTIRDNFILNCTNDGIELAGNTNQCRVFNNQTLSVGDIGISLNGDNVDQNFIKWNDINGEASDTTTGISIISGDNNFIDYNSIGQCANISSDSGSNNYWGQYNSFDEITGSFNIVAGDTTSETNKITAQDLPASGKYAIQLDIQSLDTANEGSNIDFFAFTKIDNTNLRKVGTTRFIEGTDSIMGPIEFHAKGGDSVFQLASQVSTAVTGDRAVPFKIVKVT